MKAVALENGHALIGENGFTTLYQEDRTGKVNRISLSYEKVKQIFEASRDNYFNDSDLPF